MYNCTKGIVILRLNLLQRNMRFEVLLFVLFLLVHFTKCDSITEIEDRCAKYPGLEGTGESINYF